MLDNCNSFIVFQGVLNDDIVHIVDKGKMFKGGFIAVLEYYTYLNEWNNKKNYKYFRNLDTLKKYIDKKYNNPDIELYQNE